MSGSSGVAPGGPNFPFVQNNIKTGLYKAVIPFKGKRQSFGPFTTSGFNNSSKKSMRTTPLSRGAKRAGKDTQQVTTQLHELKQTVERRAECRQAHLSLLQSVCGKQVVLRFPRRCSDGVASQPAPTSHRASAGARSADGPRLARRLARGRAFHGAPTPARGRGGSPRVGRGGRAR